MTSRLALVLLALGALSVGCATVRQGDVGVKRTLGRIDPEPLGPGVRLVNPLVTRVIRVPVRTVNLELGLDLPSREGLNVRSELSILYRVRPADAPRVISDVGPDYERALILAVFRSAAADVTARYMAKDMHSGSRGAIEAEIRDLMAKNLNDRGFDVEAVLLKSITLPPGLYQAVEAKLAAEQEAQRMQFVLQREELEAQRKRIEAEGVAAAQGALAEAISPAVIEWARIEAFRALATSPNAKVIVAPAETNLMMPIDGHVPAR